MEQELKLFTTKEAVPTIFFGGHGFLGKNCNLEAIRPTSQECDLLKYESVYSYLSKFQSQKLNVVNAAAKVAGFTYNRTRNVEMLWNNSTMALNLMRCIKEWGLECYYLYVSSVCGYKDGNSTEDLFFNGEPGINNFGYGMAKRLGVAASRSLELDTGEKVKVCNLISSNLFGPEDDFSDETSHVIPALIKKVVAGGDVKVLGNIANERDFLYVGDLGEVVEKCVTRQITGTYNVSSGFNVSIYYLANQIRDIFGNPDQTFISEPMVNEPEKRRVNSSKLKNKMIDFCPTSLREGLIKTKEWLNGSS